MKPSMLRNLFVLTLVTIGTYYALQGAFYALLFYIWNAYFRPEEWLWTNILKNLPLSFVIGCYVITATLFSKSRFTINIRVIIIFLFLVHTFFSTMLSDYFEYSLIYWSDFLKSTIISYLIIVLVDDLIKFRLSLLVIALSLGFEGAKQGLVYLITSSEWSNPNQIAFLGDNNGVAIGMLMIVPIIVLLAETTIRKWSRPIYWLLLFGVLYRALSTHSRGGFLACIAMGGVYWLHSRHKVRSLLAIGVVVIIVVAALPGTYWDRMRTIQTYEEGEDRSTLGRFHFWEVALTMAKAHPFFGVGYHAYVPAYDDYDFSQGQYGHRRAVHSSIFAVWAELGYIGLVLYLLIIFTSVGSCLRLRRHTTADPTSLAIRQCADALIGSFVVSFVGGLFVNFQYQEMFWNFIGLSIALSEIARRRLPQTISSLPVKAVPKLSPSLTVR